MLRDTSASEARSRTVAVLWDVLLTPLVPPLVTTLFQRLEPDRAYADEGLLMTTSAEGSRRPAGSSSIQALVFSLFATSRACYLQVVAGDDAPPRRPRNRSARWSCSRSAG